MWAVHKYESGLGSYLGEPIKYILINEHGFFFHTPIDPVYWGRLPTTAPWMTTICEAKNVCLVSKLEALVLFGLHDGNAEEIGIS